MNQAGNGIEGLLRARAKDTETRRNRVAAAVTELQRAGTPLTISAVARAAGVHRSFLHRHTDLSAAIHAAEAPSPSEATNRASGRPQHHAAHVESDVNAAQTTDPSCADAKTPTELPRQQEVRREAHPVVVVPPACGSRCPAADGGKGTASLNDREHGRRDRLSKAPFRLSANSSGLPNRSPRFGSA